MLLRFIFSFEIIANLVSLLTNAIFLNSKTVTDVHTEKG
jgi:hypothetical protein